MPIIESVYAYERNHSYLLFSFLSGEKNGKHGELRKT